MIPTFALALLMMWQGTTSVPPQIGNEIAQPSHSESIGSDDGRVRNCVAHGVNEKGEKYSVPVECPLQPVKPSPQITAVRAESMDEVIWTSAHMEQDWPGKYLWQRLPEKDGKFNLHNAKINATFPRAWHRMTYWCSDKSAILLHSEDGSQHWCLKIAN